MFLHLLKRIRGTSSNSTRRIRRPPPVRCRASMEILESRALLTGGYSVSQILSAFSQGEAAFSQVVQPVAETAFGLHLPMLQQSLADAVGLASTMETPLNAPIASTNALGQATSELQGVFQSVNLSTTPDANNNLLQVTWQSAVASQPASFSVGGATDFSYFDSGVQGQLQGSLSGQTQGLAVTLTMGVDVNPSTGVLAFYVADSSGASIHGIQAEGSASGQLTIGSLAGVSVSGSVALNSSATMSFNDARPSDPKLRISDFQSDLSGIVSGHVNGSVTFTGVSLDASILGSDDMCWSGHWGDTITNNVVTQTDATLLAPPTATESSVLIRELEGITGELPLLSDIQGALNTDLPLINETPAQLAGLGSVESLLEGLGGILPGLTININPTTINDLIQGQDVDLLDFSSSYTQPQENINLFTIPLASFGLPPIASFNLDATLGVEFSWSYSVGFGVDTHGFFLDPNNFITASISPNANIQGTVDVLGIPLAGASGSLNFKITAAADLFDPFGSSRYYLSQIDQGQSVGQALLNDLDASLTESLSVQLKAWFLLWSASWNWNLQSSTPFSITHLEWDPSDDYQLRSDHTLWQMSQSGPVEVDSGVLAFSNVGDGSLMVLKTDGDVIQEGRLWQRVVAQNVLNNAVDNQGNPVNLQDATQYGVDNAGNVFALTSNGDLWRVLDAGQSGAPVATVVRYGGQSFEIDSADTVFALSQNGNLDCGVALDSPGPGSWTGIAANVSQYDVDRADALFILSNGDVVRGLDFDDPSEGSWTTIAYGMQSFAVDNDDTIFTFARDGTLYRGLGLDQPTGQNWTVISYGMQSFAVDANDTVFSFATNGLLWAGINLDQPGNGSWNVIGTNVESYTVDSDDTVFFQAFNGEVWRGLNVDQTGTGNNWVDIGYGMSSIAVDSADTVYSIATNGVVWRGLGLDHPGGGSWTILGTTEQETQVGTDGTVYMLEQNDNLIRIQGLDQGSATTTITPGVESFTLVGGGTGLVYIGTDGNLYQVQGGSTTLIHSGVASLTLGSDGSTVYFLADDWSVWEENGDQEIPITSNAPGSYAAPTGGTPNLAGNWFANGTQATEIIQNGTSLTFINEGDQAGYLCNGYYAGNNEVVAPGWNWTGTVESTPTGLQIVWNTGVIWNQNRIAGSWSIGEGRPTSVIQDGNNLLFVNENGNWSSGFFIGGNEVEATGWGGLTGNVVTTSSGVQIQWANGTTWNQGQTQLADTWYADLSGNGQDDRIFRGVGNTFYVSQWSGYGFSTPSLWVQEGGPFLDDQVFFADLTGNGRDDMIYRGADNSFWVSLSTGTSFAPPQLWVTEGGPYETGQVFFADLTGNGMDDMIYRGVDNRFWVSLATGSGFAPPQLWASEGGPFVDGQVQFADLTGNGKADMIFQGVNNQFWVSLSTGIGFLSPQLWATEGGAYLAGEAQYADLTGNGKDDLIYRGVNNQFWVSLSTGTGFLPAQPWVTEGGPYLNGQAQYADLTGNGKGDLIFQGLDNSFAVSLSTGSIFAPSQSGAAGAPGVGSVVSTIADGDGGLFVLYANGTVNHYTYGVGWATIDPQVGDVASMVAAGDGGIFLLHSNGTVNHYTYGVGWATVDPGVGDVLSMVAAGDGGIFLLHSNGTLNHYTLGIGWTTVDSGTGDVVSIANANDGAISVVKSDGSRWFYSMTSGWVYLG